MERRTPAKGAGAARTCRKSKQSFRGKTGKRPTETLSRSLPEPDYGEAVEIVQKMHEERRSAQAIKILKADIDNATKMAKEALQEYRRYMSDSNLHCMEDFMGSYLSKPAKW